MHEPVLLKESIDGLHIIKGGRYIDATLGAGGHTREILERGGEVLGIDQDKNMIEVAHDNLKDIKACPFFKLVYGNFRNIRELAKKNDFAPADGILMDLGISSLHYDKFKRGFSFQDRSAPLDMRLDESLGVKASDLLNSLDKSQLTMMFNEFLSWEDTRKLVQKILARRENEPFSTVGDFVDLFEDKRPGKVHPATKAFMVLRIAVNTELETLSESLPSAFSILDKGGRLAIITFHSGEDKVVKKYFKSLAEKNAAKLVTNKPIVPETEEVSKNPRSRSAKLRIIEKNEVYKQQTK